MDISLHEDGARCAVALAGALDIYAAESLRAALLDALSRHAALDLDLSGVDEIDSAGLQVLMAAKVMAGAEGGELTMRGHSPAVLDVLELTRLQGYFGDPVVELGAAAREGN